jgi:hypothetical protein
MATAHKQHNGQRHIRTQQTKLTQDNKMACHHTHGTHHLKNWTALRPQMGGTLAEQTAVATCSSALTFLLLLVAACIHGGTACIACRSCSCCCCWLLHWLVGVEACQARPHSCHGIRSKAAVAAGSCKVVERAAGALRRLPLLELCLLQARPG